jgi:chromosome segregation ATPase
MQEISLKKKVSIIKLYLEGLSYDEIAARGNISKGTVANIISELKAGRFPEYSDLPEQLELLRELAVDLRKSRITSIQAVLGASMFSRLQELGIEPSEMGSLSDLCRSLDKEGMEVRPFLNAARALEEERERSGLSVEELEMKVRDLEETANRLEPLKREVKAYATQLTDLGEKRRVMTEKVTTLEERTKVLGNNVKYKEQRETALSGRIIELEDRAQNADERLATARKDIKTLSDIGISLDSLSGFAERLKGIAQRHNIRPEDLSNRLLSELEQLNKCIGLETILQDKENEIRNLEDIILKKKDKAAEITSTNETLRQEQSSLRASLLEERKHIITDIKGINAVARVAITQLKEDLSAGIRESTAEVNKLGDQALEIGKDLGRFDETVESNQWLIALKGLVKGESIDQSEVRQIGIVVLRGMQTYLVTDTSDYGSPSLLKLQIDNLIEALVRWKS